MNICSTSISYKYDSKLKSNALHFFNVGDEPTKGKLPLSSTKEAGRFPLPIKFAMSFISENSYLLSIFTFFFNRSVNVFFKFHAGKGYHISHSVSANVLWHGWVYPFF